MKIAVASLNENVAEHFGHCECFYVFETHEGKLTDGKAVANPGHKPGFLPNFLNDLGVNVIIAGGMGMAAVEIFNSHDIEVVIGAKGDVKKAAGAYLAGELESTGSICHEHEAH
ncbi:MAG: NifB/NifX family molybdenum-iron cluster-binding protein [Clostridia bacterium]|nr:NifB/NifX family molybdenum-iron cluster-binding protein [Clostridia bacterium]